MVSDCVSSIRRPNPTLDRPTMRPVPAAKRGIDALDALTQMFTTIPGYQLPPDLAAREDHSGCGVRLRPRNALTSE